MCRVSPSVVPKSSVTPFVALIAGFLSAAATDMENHRYE